MNRLSMTAKEKQETVIRSYLKPKLKEEGYRTSGHTWWKFIDDFFIVINLQNSQWNTKNEISFCFNIGVGLTKRLKNPQVRKANHFDTITHLREDAYLSGERKIHKYRKKGWLGYGMTDSTDVPEFINELKKDFEEDILPKLKSLHNVQDCIEFYKQFDFWGDRLQKMYNEVLNV